MRTESECLLFHSLFRQSILFLFSVKILSGCLQFLVHKFFMGNVVSCISIAQACKYRIKHNEMGLGLSGNSAVFGAGSGPAKSY